MKYFLIIFATFILLLILGFLWYEWRPSQLTKACHLWSLDRAASIDGDREDVNYFNKKCLRENGIDK